MATTSKRLPAHDPGLPEQHPGTGQFRCERVGAISGLDQDGSHQVADRRMQRIRPMGVGPQGLRRAQDGLRDGLGIAWRCDGGLDGELKPWPLPGIMDVQGGMDGLVTPYGMIGNGLGERHDASS
jgi:hypothetical protein